MPRSSSLSGRRRPLRFESLEDRTLLSISPLGDVFDLVPEVSLSSSSSVAASALAGNPHALTGLDRVWADYGLTGAGQTVAVIDTGVAYDHLAFGGRVVGGYDFAERDADPYDDGYYGGHGTHVAGILAGSAAPRSSAASGVATAADIVALRVFDDAGRSQFAWVEEALRWVHQHRNAFEHPITAVNLSLGGQWNAESPPNWAVLEDELAQLAADGIFIAVAAGNSFATYGTTGLSYPAASSHVVPVGAVNANGSLSAFSQRSTRMLAAPGEMILSAVPDYLGDWNGVGDDFKYMSGTSMAAPYVAGASMLLREAYALTGVENVSQAVLYQTMVTTADDLFDPVTRKTYARLNLANAVEYVLPDDPYSTAATAQPLGVVVDTASVAGMIQRRSDEDWFAFTAGKSGLMKIAASRLPGDVQWRVADVEAETTAAGDTLLSFKVKAGETYRFALTGGQTLGRYQLGLTLTPQADVTAWGTIDQVAKTGTRISPAGQTFSFAAARDGVLTIEATFADRSQSITLELRDAAGNVLAKGRAVDGRLRLDVTVAAGQSLMLDARASGANAVSVDFRITNLVRFASTTVYVTGTEAGDAFWLDANIGQVGINGVVYQVASGAWLASFDGRGGNDTARLVGTDGADGATIRPGWAELVGPGYRVAVSNTETLQIDMAGGADRASLWDSAGDDAFEAGGGAARMVGPGFEHRVFNCETVYAYAASGGDRATLRDSAGNDSFVATPSYASMTGGGFATRAVGFDRVDVRSTAGLDQAVLYDSAGDDLLLAGAGRARLVGRGFDNRIEGFVLATVYASAGGRDTAAFDSSAATRTLVGKTAELRGPASVLRAKYFEELTDLDPLMAWLSDEDINPTAAAKKSTNSKSQ